MNRSLLGRFEPGRPLELDPGGPAAAASSPLCLLDGHLDELDRLREELRLPGRGEGLTAEETLAAAYVRWGVGMLERLRGDFAILVWDAAAGRGLLARDQLGLRPLYIHRTASTVRFATEIHRLVESLPRRPRPDPAGVAHWLAVSTRPGSETLYAGVSRLGPGEALLFGRSGARSHRFWAPRFREPEPLGDEELAARTRTALEASVRRRLAADGSSAVLMSGGLDSSAIAALGVGLAGDRVVGCSAVFPEHPAADESELIATLRADLGIGGVTAEVRPGGLLAGAVEYVEAWQMPLLGWGDFWTLPLMRAAAGQGATVILDGDGGDELFGPRQLLLADELRAGHPRRVAALARRLPGAGPHLSRREVARVLGGIAEAALPLPLNRLGETVRRRRAAPGWLNRDARRALHDSEDPLAWRRLEGPLWWSHLAHRLSSELDQAGVFEHQRRRSTMAAVAARHPLLDLDLVELAIAQPPRSSLDPRYNRPLLRRSMASLLPDSVRLRPQKARFESLIVSCLQGPDGDLCRRLLLDPGAELRAYVDQAQMGRALFETSELIDNDPFRWMWLLWRHLTAELWLRAQRDPRQVSLPLAPSSPEVRIV